MNQMVDRIENGAQTMSRIMLQRLAEHAGLGLGMSASRAARFGSVVAQHLADGHEVDDLLGIIAEPAALEQLFDRVDALIEMASLAQKRISMTHPPEPVLQSAIRALPCAVQLSQTDGAWSVYIQAQEASTISRPAQLDPPVALIDSLQAVATTRPGGAALMEL